MNKCPLCNSTDNELLYTNSRGNKYLENYVCGPCGFVYVFPRIPDEKINELYVEGKFSKEARKSTVPDLSKFKQTEIFALERVHLLEEKLPAFFSSPKNILEIGCGTGSFLWLMQSRKHLAKGIEPDKVFAEVGACRYLIDIDSVLFDAFESETKFDLICNFHVIEHILDPREFISKIKNHLSDNGYVYIECPTIDNIYTGDLNTFFWDVHVNTFSNITLPWLIESEGFTIVDTFVNKRGFVSVIASNQKGMRKYKPDNKGRIIEIIVNYNKGNSVSKSILTKIKRWLIKAIK